MTCAFVSTARFARPRAGRRYATAVEQRKPRRVVTQAAQFAPSGTLDVANKSYVLRLLPGLRDSSTNANPLDGNLNQAADGSPADDATALLAAITTAH